MRARYIYEQSWRHLTGNPNDGLHSRCGVRPLPDGDGTEKDRLWIPGRIRAGKELLDIGIPHPFGAPQYPERISTILLAPVSVVNRSLASPAYFGIPVDEVRIERVSWFGTDSVCSAGRERRSTRPSSMNNGQRG